MLHILKHYCQFLRNSVLILTGLIVMCQGTKAQIAVGAWRDHLSYSHVFEVAEGGNRIYCATSGAIFYYDKYDYSVNKLSKVNGLSDVGISSIAYDTKTNKLIIAYTNGNIDLIVGDETTNIPDIRNKQVTGSKSINRIYIRDNYAYLATGFGVVVLDISRLEVNDTYYIGPNGDDVVVNDILIENDHIYAATERGIFQADLSSPNLADFQYWSRIQNIPNYTKNFSNIASFNDIIYMVSKGSVYSTDTLYTYTNGEWSYFDSTSYHTITNLFVSKDYLFLTTESYLLRLDATSVAWMMYPASLTNKKPRHALVDNNGITWIADMQHGLVKFLTNYNATSIYPNGPATNLIFDLNYADNKVYAVAGGRNSSWNNNYNIGEMYYFVTETWQTYRSPNTWDFVSVIVNPLNSAQTFVSTWNYGLLEFNNNSLKTRYTEANSSLQSIFTPNSFVRISGTVFDQNENLWITNDQVSEPISVFLKDSIKINGNWTRWVSFPYSGYFEEDFIDEIIITPNGHKWISLPRGQGLLAFDEKGTFDNEQDDDVKFFKILDENGSSLNNDIFSIAVDLDGLIWIGTNEGVVVYYSPENVFSGQNFYAQRIIIDLDGSAQYLLGTETVTAIAIDGANRKWFGTANAGAFLMSDDGTEQIQNFNDKNSPLLSNNIIDITINDVSGEVFFGTDQGLISYKSTATKGNDYFEDVYVFPNPVREDYFGVITIKNLVTSSNVKITDITGNLVFETTATGGQAIWDGYNFDGRRVHSGVYLVFCSNEDGSKTHITKLLVIN